MAEPCFCTAHAAADCEGGGLPPAHDGWCSCACHGGAEATDAVAAPEPECTGIFSRWCPRHGDCTCPEPELSLDSETCPLHGSRSAHGEEATETTEEVLLRERDEARAERDALLRARDHELQWDPNGPVPSDPIELRERFCRLRWALYSLGPVLRAFNMLARLHRLDPSSANAERLVNLVGAEHEDLRVARREREAIATVCGLDACPSICLEALAPAVAKRGPAARPRGAGAAVGRDRRGTGADHPTGRADDGGGP